MRLRGLSRKRVAAGLAAAAAAIAGTVAIVLATSRPAAISVRDLRIAVVDGPHDNQHVVLDATFFTPRGGGRVPAILLAHGFGETKDAVRPQAEQLAQAGFAVLTWTARGFGNSTGQMALDSPDYEVKDVEQLVTWLARQPQVRLDGPGDPRVGIAGASYGGGIALLAAAYDHRIDAIVPQITWNNLATALFPNAAGGGPADGVFKKQWAGLLFTQGAVGFGDGRRRSAARASGSRTSGASAGQRGGLAEPGSAAAALAWPVRQRGPGGPVRAFPAPDLRHLPAGRRGRPGHAAGDLAAAAVQPGERSQPDRRPDAADPGRERLPLRAGSGHRELPGDQA